MWEKMTNEYEVYKEFLLSLRGTISPEHCETLAAMIAVLWANSSDDIIDNDDTYVARAYSRAQFALRLLADKERTQ